MTVDGAYLIIHHDDTSAKRQYRHDRTSVRWLTVYTCRCVRVRQHSPLLFSSVHILTDDPASAYSRPRHREPEPNRRHLAETQHPHNHEQTQNVTNANEGFYTMDCEVVLSIKRTAQKQK